MADVPGTMTRAARAGPHDSDDFGALLAPLAEVRVSAGDRVHKGQTLIRLDGKNLAAGARATRSAASAGEQGANVSAAEIQAAEAGLALARASHDRIAGLQAKRSATSQELMMPRRRCERRSARRRCDRAGVAGRVGRREARAASDQASATESFATIAAPFDGMVTEKLVEPGTWRHQACPFSASRTPADFASRSAWTNRASARFETATASRRPRTRVTPITGVVTEVGRAVDAMRARFWSRSRSRYSSPSIRRIREGATSW